MPSYLADPTKPEYLNPINGISPQDYGGTIKQGYQALGQPASVNRDEAITYNAVLSLANNFVNKITQKTGKIPSEDQVKAFVASTLTPGFAQQFIQGIGNDQIRANYVDPYISENAGTLGIGGGQGDIEKRLLGLNDQLNKVYDTGRKSLISGIEDTYGTQKRGLADDLAGQGLLGQPTSRYSLDRLEANKGKSIQSGLNVLEGQRAGGAVDLAGTIESLLANERRAGDARAESGRNFRANREDTYFNRGLQSRQLDMASQLGRLQAGAGGDNGLMGGLGGATSGALIGSKLLPGWGTAIGAVGGGLLGYFGSRR